MSKVVSSFHSDANTAGFTFIFRIFKIFNIAAWNGMVG